MHFLKNFRCFSIEFAAKSNIENFIEVKAK